MKTQEKISLEEVKKLLLKWFEIVETGGDPKLRESLYLYPHSRFIMPDGTSMDFVHHHKMHIKWCDERHECGTLYMTPLCDQPPRVRVECTVYWEARYKNKEPKQVIKTVVGKSMIIEKNKEGALKFVLHQNIFFHLLPDSAPIDLN